MHYKTEKLPQKWDWSNITTAEQSLYEKLFNIQIAKGTYTSQIFDQHMSKWCGCCYLISTLQTIQDKMNIALGIRSPDSFMLPYFEIDAQYALDTYNEYRRIVHPDWNACHGGNPETLIKAMQNEKIPLVLTTSDGFAWYGYPKSSTIINDRNKDVVNLFPKKEVIVQNDINTVQSTILQEGPLVLAINANCLLDASLSKRKGLIDTDIFGPRNHAVSVIGWKLIDGRNCWIARNSWGDLVPESKPSSIDCVRTDSNTCEVPLKKWTSDKINKGLFYIPFDYGHIRRAPSPWYSCIPMQLYNLHNLQTLDVSF
tara:strand:+ start:666 stop:1604 length:939 start_codon:yes stop_codon:yes gene_type:complete